MLILNDAVSLHNGWCVINQQGYLTQLASRSNYIYDAGAKTYKQKRNKAAMKFYPINPFAGYYLLHHQMNGAEATSHVLRLSEVPNRWSRVGRNREHQDGTNLSNYAIKTKDKGH